MDVAATPPEASTRLTGAGALGSRTGNRHSSRREGTQPGQIASTGVSPARRALRRVPAVLLLAALLTVTAAAGARATPRPPSAAHHGPLPPQVLSAADLGALPHPDAATGDGGISGMAWNPHLHAYLAVYSRPLADQVVARTAPAPQGPWGAEALLFTGAPAPPGSYDYLGLQHPELATDRGRRIVVTYSHLLDAFHAEIRVVAVRLTPAGLPQLAGEREARGDAPRDDVAAAEEDVRDRA